MIQMIKNYFMPPMADEELIGIAAVTETDQWDYVLLGKK